MHENARKNRLADSAAVIEQHTPKAVEPSTGQRKLAHTIREAVQASGLSRSISMSPSGVANCLRGNVVRAP